MLPAICCRDCCSTVLLDRLYDRPAGGEVDLVDTELLLAISVANASVDVVVVEERSLLRVPVDTLTTRTIDPAVGLENSGTTTLSALLTSLVDEATGSAGGPADLNFVLLTCGRTVGVETAAFADREEEVVVVTALGNVGSLLGVLAVRLESDVGGCTTSALERWVVHANGEQIVPERSERYDELGAIPVESTIDGVVVLAGLRGDAGATVVGPGANSEGFGSRDTDGGVLNTERGDGVVEVVCVADKGDVRCLSSVSKVQCIMTWKSLTQRSFLPLRLILDPAGMAAPL